MGTNEDHRIVTGHGHALAAMRPVHRRDRIHRVVRLVDLIGDFVALISPSLLLFALAAAMPDRLVVIYT